MNIQKVSIDSLVPDPRNPRTHDERNLSAIRASLHAHGQVEPLLIQRSTKMIIAGNGRAIAMKSMGWTEVEAVVLDVDDTDARRLSISLNRSGELAGWDEEILASHLQDLSAIDIDWESESLGFNDGEMDELLAAYGNIDTMESEPEVEKEKIAKSDEEEPEEEDDDDGLPEGASPSHMPTSSAKIVQLFFDEDLIGVFQMTIRRLAKHYGTDNITDTVFKAVTEAERQNHDED